MSNIHAGEGLFENDLFTRGGKFTILLPRVSTTGYSHFTLMQHRWFYSSLFHH
jgi:hypothetical protein